MSHVLNSETSSASDQRMLVTVTPSTCRSWLAPATRNSNGRDRDIRDSTGPMASRYFVVVGLPYPPTTRASLDASDAGRAGANFVVSTLVGTMLT